MNNKTKATATTKTGKSALLPKLRFPEFRNAPEWAEKKLEKVFAEEIEKGHPEKTVLSATQDRGVIPYELLDKSVIRDRKNLSGYKLVRKGNFVISLRSFEGGFEYSDYEGIISPAYVILGKRHEINNFFFQVMFKSSPFIKKIHKLLNNSLRDGKSISYNQAKEIELTIPPLPEQKKIADCLSSLDELITAQAQELEALRAHKKGLMQLLFPAQGETLPKLRFPEFRNAPEWEQKPLSKICDVLQGYGFPEVLQGRCAGKYPFCKVSDISKAVAEKGGCLDEAANYVGDEELLKLRAKLVPVGATVFAKIGEALRLNRRALVKKECLIDNNAVGLKAISGIAGDYFVFILSQKIDLNEHCGGAVPSVNKSTLEEIMVTVPDDPKEQKRIADCLLSVDEFIAAQAQKVEALKAHKKGLMQLLFPATTEAQ